MDLKRIEPAIHVAQINLGIASKEARVRTECATHAEQLAILRVNVHPKLSA